MLEADQQIPIKSPIILYFPHISLNQRTFIILHRRRARQSKLRRSLWMQEVHHRLGTGTDNDWGHHGSDLVVGDGNTEDPPFHVLFMLRHQSVHSVTAGQPFAHQELPVKSCQGQNLQQEKDSSQGAWKHAWPFDVIFQDMLRWIQGQNDHGHDVSHNSSAIDEKVPTKETPPTQLDFVHLLRDFAEDFGCSFHQSGQFDGDLFQIFLQKQGGCHVGECGW